MNEKKENLGNDSLVEIAYKEMENDKKKKPQTIESLYKKIFKKYGVEESNEIISQFEIDFMLSGHFVYCGEDEKGHKLWNLKKREKSDLLDKEGGHLEDIFEEDEEVTKNELKDENVYDVEINKEAQEEVEDEDFDEEVEEEDDIANELGASFNEEEPESTYEIDEDEEDEEDSYDDKDE